MPANLVAAIENYLRSRNLSRGTRDEYSVSPLLTSRPIGIQSDYHYPATVSVFVVGQGNGWRVPMLLPEILSIEVRFGRATRAE